jgi:crotonobetainyl-CoA:carnitine CoA-transferase CaiB-like acyl-CoA transferase
MPGPLSGYKIVDLTAMISRPLTTMILADQGADVLIQNFRPGVAERMGLGEDAVPQVAPDILYVAISGFGERGPYAGKPVFDPLVQALSRLTTLQAGAAPLEPSRASSASYLARAGGCLSHTLGNPHVRF